MKLANKISKRLYFLTNSYGFSCVQNADETISFSNDKTTITFEYDAYRHEYFDMSITCDDVVMMKVVYGNVTWSDDIFIDEQFSQRLEAFFKLRQQFVTLSEKQIDELIEIYAEYIEEKVERIR